MTLNQLDSLDEQELALALVIVNVVAPPASPIMTFEPRHLTWFKHDMLIKKFLDVFPKLKPEGHATYVSLMHKLGVCVQIQPPPGPQPSNENQGTETTGSIGCPPSQSLSPDVQNITGSNDTGEPTRPLEV